MLLPKLSTLLSLVLSCKQCFATPVPVSDVDDVLEPRGFNYPSAAGRLFNIDGKKQYFSGVNAWWLGHLWSNADVDQALGQIASTGYKVARVWAFGNTNNPATETNVYYQTLNSSGGFINYADSNGIPRLDYVVQKAEALNIKLIMVLLNNFDALGGINTYSNAFGGDHNSFYTNAKAQAAYQKYIKFIVKRYKKSPSIFSWELCNEPRCSQCQTSVITNWARTTSAYIKGLDSKHMVSLGDEGWFAPANNPAPGDTSYAYSGYEGVDFVENLAIPTLDYGTVHMYPNQWGYDYSWGSTWILQHNAVGAQANKPVMMEEYAAPSTELRLQWMTEWQQTILKNTSIAGDMIWQFGTSFTDANPFDEYAVYYNTDPASEYQILGAQQAKVMAAKKPVAKL